MNVFRRQIELVEREPTLTWRPLPTQYTFLASPHGRRLLRAGNQWGKTTAGAVDLIAAVTGVNPWCPEMAMPAFINRRGQSRIAEPGEQGGIEAWVVCASWSQSAAVQKKIYELLPKHLLHPDDTYDEVQGFGVKDPKFRVKHKSGGWSLVRIKTMGQGGLRLASATIQYAWFDEPPETERIYTEITKRVMRAGRFGRVILTMTPINAPVAWIKKAVEEEKRIEDHHARMEPKEFCPMVPAGEGRWVHGPTPVILADGTVCNQAWIDSILADTPAHEVDVICHGEWEGRAVGAYFGPVFRPAQHVADVPLTGRWRLLLGVDHGHQPGKQCAVLVLARKVGLHWQVYVLDEYVDATGTAKPEDDAKAILQMIRRHGWDWHNLDEARGDRIHMKGTDSEKSNEDLMVHLSLSLELAAPRLLRPQVETAKQGSGHLQGSVKAGTRWLYHAMARPGGFHLHPRCKVGKVAIERYVEKDDEYGSKDWLDALRYALDGLIFERDTAPGAAVRFG